MSPELRLMIAPGETYAALARVPGRMMWLTALRPWEMLRWKPGGGAWMPSR